MYGILFQYLSISLGCFCPHLFYEHSGTSPLLPFLVEGFTLVGVHVWIDGEMSCESTKLRMKSFNRSDILNSAAGDPQIWIYAINFTPDLSP